MHIEDRLTNVEERLSRMEARVSALEPGGEPEPAQHPLAGLEYQWTRMAVDGVWTDPTDISVPALREQYAHELVWRDSTTHAPVPLWQVAKRLGVERPVPDAVRWTDVEYEHKHSGEWIPCDGSYMQLQKSEWESDAYHPHSLRLTAQYDHQEISYGQFREILSREDKPAEPEAVLYREDVEAGLLTWGVRSNPSSYWEDPARDPDWKFRNRHTQQPITREQFMQAIRNSEEREAKAKAANLSPAEAFERANRGGWVKSGGYKWRNTDKGGQYLAFGEYPGSIRECGRFERTAFEGKEWVAWNPATASEAKPAPEFRVGDLVEVVRAENTFSLLGLQFVILDIEGDALRFSKHSWITQDCVNLISRPNP